MAGTHVQGARLSWLPFVAGTFAFFTIMAGATLPTPLYPIYSSTYGFSPFVITTIFAVYSVGVIGALLITGPWSDQVGRKPLLLGGLAMAVLSAIAFVFASGLPLLLLARLLQGISVGIFTSSGTVAVTEMAPEDRPQIASMGATAANMGGLGAGSILSGVMVWLLPAPLVAPYLVHLVMVGGAILLLLAVPEPGETAENPKLRPQGLAVPPEVRDLFVPAAISAFGGFMVCGFMGSVAPSFLGQILGRQGEYVLIGTVAGLIFLASCFGQIAGQALSSRVVLPVGMGVLSVGIGAITAALWAATLPGLVMAIAVAGFGHGIAFKGGLAAVVRNAPQGQASHVTATYFTVAYVAISIPVMVVGVLTEPVGLLPTAVGYGVVSTLLSVTAFFIILGRSRRG